jgi:SAM-dependent methyltransferase
MYAFLKRIVLRWIPKKWLLANETHIRQVMAWFYRGNRFECNICNARLSKFILLKNGEQLCPQCGSLPRNRRLWQMLNADFQLKGKLLDFSPTRCLYRKLKQHPAVTYIATDFANEFLADFQYDITNMPEPDDSFDLICCFHILEHIDDDRQAMRELLRVLKPGGVCLIQTPFKLGDIYENASVQTPQERKIHFGQEDHVRIYSVQGLQNRLENAGFEVIVKKFQELPDDRFGFKPIEIILICKK